jgi:PTS system nitrogen regulatory IIA component
MTLAELARFLHVGQKTVLKLARAKKIPAAKLGDEWRFRRDDIDEWLERQLHEEEDGDFAAMTDGMRLPLGDLMPDKSIIHDMVATEPLGAIEELAARAYGNNWLNDKPWFVGALVEREALASTAMEGGVAFLHTRARDTSKISRPFVIVGRSYQGIEFGAPDGELTYLFFLLGLKYDKLHLPILGRLARVMLRDPRTINRLRSTTSPTKMRNILLTLDAKELEAVNPGTVEARRADPVLDRNMRLRSIMRVQAQRKHREEKEAEAGRKAAIKAKKAAAADEKKRLAAEKRKAKTEAKKKKAAEKKQKAAEARKKKAAAAKKKKEAAAKKKKAAAAKKKAADAKKKKAAAAGKKKAASKKKGASKRSKSAGKGSRK